MRREDPASGAGPDELLAAAEVTDRHGYPYIVHPLMDGVPRVRPALLRAWTAWAWGQPPLRLADLLLAPEAMALPLVAPLSLQSGLPYVVARKRVYNRKGETAVAAKTGYGLSSLYVNDVYAGDRVLIVDDVLSTGSTLDGLLAAVKACGGKPVGALVFLDKGDARKGLQEKHGIPILAMRSVKVEGGRLVPRGD
jgi:adenine phosphoribosyltransferase